MYILSIAKSIKNNSQRTQRLYFWKQSSANTIFRRLWLSFNKVSIKKRSKIISNKINTKNTWFL